MRASEVHTRVQRARAPRRTTRAADRYRLCALAAWAAACGAYDASLLSSSPGQPGDAPAMPAAGTGANADTQGGSGGTTTTGDGSQDPDVPPPSMLDAALPVTDEDAGAPEPPLAPQDRKRFTIDEGFVDEDLRDFPLWVRLVGDADLMRARADGRSLYFTDAQGAVLDAEIEARDLAAGELSAWVRVPVVSSTEDTVVYLYWADGLDHSAQQSATGVWSAGFEAVFHLTDARDSSTHARHGEDLGSDPTAGQLGGARRFEDRSYIAVGQGMLPDSASYTITAWIRPDLAHCPDYCAVVTNNRTQSPFAGISLYVAGTFAPDETGALGTWEETNPIADSWHFSDEHVVASDGWHFVALALQIGSSAGGAEISLDGEPWAELHRPSDGDTSGWQNAEDGHLEIGRFVGADGFFHEYAGAIDELRIAGAARSAAWIRAEHENQRSASTFVSVATERR
jgi:hypothetical protein